MPQEKKIWMINHYAITPDMPGGTRHYDFGIELTQRGYQTTIFASDFNHTLRKRFRLKPFQLKGIEIVDGVRFVWIQTLPYKKFDFRRLLNVFSFTINVFVVGLGAEKPDVIIGSSPHIFAALSGYFLSKFKGSRFFLEVRDPWSQAMIDLGAAKESSLFIRVIQTIENFLYEKAEVIIPFAEGVAKYLAKNGVNPRKITVIPNGVHFRHFTFSQKRDDVRKAYGFMDKFVLMYTGAHGPANALHTIINAAKILVDYPHILFVLVGDGPEKGELKAMAKENGLKNVRFFDSVPKSQIPDLLNAADALTVTLRAIDAYSYGVSPNKLFDYMATDNPVICAVGGDMGKLVSDANAGISVEPENPDALAQAVLTLSRNPEQCKIFGMNGRKYIEANLSREKLVERMIDKFQLTVE